jgi:hypothetical protein
MWEELDERLSTMDLTEFSHALIQHHIEFIRERPAFTELIEAGFRSSRPVFVPRPEPFSPGMFSASYESSRRTCRRTDCEILPM